MNDVTSPSIVTWEDVEQVTRQQSEYNEALDQLERMIANYETYGEFHPVKPALGKAA